MHGALWPRQLMVRKCEHESVQFFREDVLLHYSRMLPDAPDSTLLPGRTSPHVGFSQDSGSCNSHGALKHHGFIDGSWTVPQSGFASSYDRWWRSISSSTIRTTLQSPQPLHIRYL